MQQCSQCSKRATVIRQDQRRQFNGKARKHARLHDFGRFRENTHSYCASSRSDVVGSAAAPQAMDRIREESCDQSAGCHLRQVAARKRWNGIIVLHLSQLPISWAHLGIQKSEITVSGDEHGNQQQKHERQTGKVCAREGEVRHAKRQRNAVRKLKQRVVFACVLLCFCFV